MAVVSASAAPAALTKSRLSEAEPAVRAAVWADLPARFARMGIAAQRQPWDDAGFGPRSRRG